MFNKMSLQLFEHKMAATTFHNYCATALQPSTERDIVMEIT